MFFGFSGFGQEPNRFDSLLRELEKPGKDTVSVKTLLTTGAHYLKSGSDKARTFAIKALDLSAELSYTLGLGDGNQLLAHTYRSTQPDSSLIYHLKSLRNYQAVGDIKHSSDAHWNIADVYLELGNFEAAKKHVLLFSELIVPTINNSSTEWYDLSQAKIQ